MEPNVSKFNEFIRTYWPLLIFFGVCALIFGRLDERLTTVVNNVGHISRKLDQDVVTKNDFNTYKDLMNKNMEYRLQTLEERIYRLEVSN